MKRTIQSVIITFTLLSVELVSKTQAVTPPPDGAYSGANTAEGSTALFSLTTGQNNAAVGAAALYSDTSGDQNTANGVSALRYNTTGDSNTALGFQALYF